MKTNILGVKIDRITLKEALEKTASLLDSKTQHRITTANPEIVLKAWSNGKYLDLVNNSDLVLADGIGLLWAAKFLSLKSSSFVSTVAQLIISGSSLVFSPDYCREVIPERIAGVDLMEKICEQASKNGWKVFLLGAGEGTAVETAAALKKKYLDLNIVGSESGGTLTEAGELADESLIGRINSAKPDILFTALGAPKQDKFNHMHVKTWKVPVAIGVGLARVGLACIDGGRERSSDYGDFSLRRDSDRLFGAQPTNVLLIKASYWLGL